MRYIELFYDRGHHHEFLSLSQELAAPGEMRQAQTFDFAFKNVEKQFESYQGINVKLRYVEEATNAGTHTSVVYVESRAFPKLLTLLALFPRNT